MISSLAVFYLVTSAISLMLVSKFTGQAFLVK